MKALVTGASGFIGSTIARKLRSEGWEVSGLGRGNMPPGFYGAWHQCDLSAGAPPSEATSVDLVIHCAGQAHSSGLPAEEFQRHVVTSSNNLLASIQMASGSSGRLIYLSSIKAMGESLPKGSNEQTNPKPSSPYGIAKLAVERILEQAISENALSSCTILRPSPVFGEGSKGLIGLLARLGNLGLVPRVSGHTGERSYVHVDDVASAVLAVASLGSFQTFCLSDGSSYRFNDVRAALNVEKPWSRIVPGLSRPIRSVLEFELFEKKLRLSERLFADCHVSSSNLVQRTNWMPRNQLSDWLTSNQGQRSEG